MGTGRWDDDGRRMSTRGGGGRGNDGWDRQPRGGGSRYPRRDIDDWDDPRGNRGGRPPVRDNWDAPNRGRGGPAGSSGSSRRPPQGGGLWGDETYNPRGRAGIGGPAGMRDPRAARAGRAPVEPEAGKLSFSKGAGIVFGMFLLGAAVAFGFFMLTRPNPQIDNTVPIPTNTTAPVTPTTNPNVTPSPTGLIPGAGPAYTLIVSGVAAQ